MKIRQKMYSFLLQIEEENVQGLEIGSEGLFEILKRELLISRFLAFRTIDSLRAKK